MKKIFLAFVLMYLGYVSYSQNDYSVYNERPHGDSYLLPDIFMTDGCADVNLVFDTYGYIVEDKGYWTHKWIYYGGDGVVSSVDLAQPYRIDTLTTFIGLAFVWCNNNNFGGMNAFVGLADTDFSNKITIRVDTIASNNGPYFQYKEVMFDHPVNVKGNFFATFIPPKAPPYTGYNWNAQTAPDCEAYVFTTTVRCEVQEAYRPYRHISNIPRPYTQVDTVNNNYYGRDTTWQVSGDDMAPIYNPKALYIFPIIGTFDASAPTIITNDSTSNPDDSVSLNSVDIEKSINIFPNPAINEVNIHCPQVINNIVIYNTLGQRIEENKVNSKNTIIDVSKYKKQEYLIKITTNSGVATKKFVVQ